VRRVRSAVTTPPFGKIDLVIIVTAIASAATSGLTGLYHDQPSRVPRASRPESAVITRRRAYNWINSQAEVSVVRANDPSRGASVAEFLRCR
jgi:hypothetical protein